MPAREPILNIPPVVLSLLLAFAAVHLIVWKVLTPDQVDEVLGLFAFIPARYDSSVVPAVYPGGFGAEIWTFVTYAFLHADLSHIGFNSVWFVAFGTPVARRFGPVRFLVFFAVTAALGALTHLLAHPGAPYAVIGASAAISGMMAAAMRFVFHGRGPLGILRPGAGDEAYRVPAVPLRDNLRDPRVFVFLAVWFGINILVGLGAAGLTGSDQPVAWEAHIGGFVAGLLLFPLFDPVSRGVVPASREEPPEEARER